MDMTAIIEELQRKAATAGSLGATLKFDCGADGVAVIDGRSVPAVIDAINRDTDCTITISQDNLAALVSGALDPTVGFMTGKFKVSGDMSVALKLQRVL
jgi:putative sterol carrier protein